MRLLIIFLLLSANVFGADRYWVGGGSTANWSATGNTNWSATSGGANNASVPTSTDNVIFDANSGASASTISATITVLSLTITSGYTGTLTHNAVLTVGGNITLNTNYTIAGTASITISANSTIETNGKVWPNGITINTSNLTITLNSLLTVTGMLQLGTLAAGTITFTGTSGFTVGTFSCIQSGATNTAISLANGVTYTITGSIAANVSRAAAKPHFTSDHATNKAILILQQGATCNVMGNFTRIDASAGRSINTFNGVVTDCLNVNSFTDLKTVSHNFAN